MFPMVESTKTTMRYALSPAGKSQQRYTVAALVYFLYGLFYLFGAQYLTSMQATERAMSNPRLFFALGALLVVLLPLLIYSRPCHSIGSHRPRGRPSSSTLPCSWDAW
jgi:hypothetical protein